MTYHGQTMDWHNPPMSMKGVGLNGCCLGYAYIEGFLVYAFWCWETESFRWCQDVSNISYWNGDVSFK